MCGIVGLITGYNNGFSTEEAQMFRDMLVFDSVRGFDSTGVFSVDKWGDVRTLKEASTGATFVTRHAYDGWNSNLELQGQFAVGHNRAATRGVVNDENAHPFVVKDKIVLVQNGSYKGSHRHLANVDVDSHAVAIAMEEDNDIEKTLQRVNAAYAFVWYNVETKTLHIIRNSERPLFIAYLKHGGIAFASEAPFIMSAAYRAGIQLNKPPYEIKPGNLCSFKLCEDGSIDATYKDIAYEYKAPPSSQGTLFRHGNVFPYTDVDDATDLTQYYGGRTTRNPMAARDTSPVSQGANIDVKYSIWDQWNKIRGLSEYNYKTEMARKKALDNLPTTNVTVEWLEYLPANDHPDCQAWFLVGEAVSPLGEPGPVYYKLFLNVNKDTMLEYVSRPGFWSVRCNSSIPYSVGQSEFALMRFVTEMNHLPLIQGVAHAV